MTTSPRQLPLHFPSHGGRRRGAGRKPSLRPLTLHRARPALAARYPVHVTLRARASVGNLRGARLFRAVERALAEGRGRFGFRLVHFSVQFDHLHLLVEAPDAQTLTQAMRGLAVRLARRINRALGRSGAVLAGRYHARILRSPTEVRRALAYVLDNWRKHALLPVPPGTLDPRSSAHLLDVAVPGEAPVLPPGTWLLAVGWRRFRAGTASPLR